ncbi:hypothetical protein GTA08_BOTSDO02637 [Botryosphaeria dothidea]|uniref:Uncharacterized protein n=1 Tax=Botryosphaeria dothidea TaxID=55169 RepID=A0A8H4IYW9_9PEZI|nr:hypothetical protein GTA08_BOTSDO02637 [Botryosphaeria dothidea]
MQINNTTLSLHPTSAKKERKNVSIPPPVYLKSSGAGLYFPSSPTHHHHNNKTAQPFPIFPLLFHNSDTARMQHLLATLLSLLSLTSFLLASAAPQQQSDQLPNLVGDVSPDDNIDRAQLATEIGANAQGQREFLQDGVLPVSCGPTESSLEGLDEAVAADVEPCVFVQ